ncbi:hypothetical protein FDP41_005874 [Naegleria fowleri]|uniref:Uncharacterized protein n=1 Tax=Naegleria fowleri TaxID=5763 RepID=A0A6A5BL82_NAEFO|nr:uncharacterized protein FDP41_005874 [Naegleria fowleri]KAF0975121.1 hypothetical protein FDP41_005874 [Naegleria fowleri]CAG4709933.1 unnamed protein product [Naegleria fowleri]
MASRHRDFKIKAWPIVSHTSNDQRAETDVLWPFIRYERNGTKSKFSIRPFLFKFERDSASHEFSIMFLFYSIFYKVAFDATVTLLLLPLLTFHRKSKEYQLTVIFSGLLYFLHESFVKKAKTLALLPLMYFSKQKQIGSPDAVTFQTFLFPFFWRYKSKVTNIMLILPLYFFFENDKFYINQMWPFIGTQKRAGRYTEFSILYPLFRVRKGQNNFTLHLPWPFLKLQIAPEKISFRFLPVCWIRVLRNGGSRGFVFFFYWKHVSASNCTKFDPPKFTFGIWGLLHIKIANGTENKGHHIFWIFMLLFYRKTSSYRYLFLTPLFMHYLTYIDTKVLTRKVFLMPVFYFSEQVDSLSRKESFMTVLLLYWYICSIHKVSHHIFLPLYWYTQDSSNDHIYIDRRVFIFPILTYGGWKKSIQEQVGVQHETILNCCYLLYWHRCARDKHFRVWLFLIFYYSDIRDVKTFLLSLVFYVRREKDNNRLFILFIYSSFKRKYWYSLKTYPLFMWIKYEKYTRTKDEQEELTDYCHVFICGLIGRFRDIVHQHTFVWIIPLYFSSVNEKYQESTRFGSLFFLPPYFYHSTDQGKVESSFVLPFFIYKVNWKYMYIFPFFFVRMDRKKKSIHLHFIFDLNIDSEKNEYYFKFLYIPKTRYCLVQADCSYIGSKGASNLKRTRFFIFPLFYYQNRALETPDLDNKNRKLEAPLITISLIWLLHNMCLGKIIIDKRELVKSFYLMPLFYVRIDRNNQVVSAQRNGQFFSVSLLYLVNEKFAFFRYSRLITPNNHSSSIFLFLLFFSTVRNWWAGSNDSMTLQNEHTFALLWIYKPEYSLIYWSRQFSTTAFYYFCLYAFPLFWYEVNQQFSSIEETTEKNVSILWFIYKRFALFNQSISFRTEANSSSNILSSTSTTFLFPIYYHSLTDSYKVWKFLWLPSHDSTGFSIVNWFVKYDSSTTFVPVQIRKVVSERYHFLPIFYRELEYDLSATSNTTTLNTSTVTMGTNDHVDASMVSTPVKKATRKVNYLFWIFDRRFSWIRVWSNKTSNTDQHGFYIFLLILMSSSAHQNTLKKVFCLFWVFTKWLSFFHHCVECSGSSSILSHTPSDYSLISTRQFTLGLHFYRKDLTNDHLKLKEFYLLWFLHKYVSIVAFWNYISQNTSETGTYLFPLYIWKKECSASKRVNSWSLCWFFHKYAAIFHRSTISTDRKPGSTSVSTTMDDFDHHEFTTFLVPLFFFTNKNNESRNLAVFWFFVQRIRFIGILKSPKSFDFFIYPWVSYETTTNDTSNYLSISLIYVIQKYVSLFCYTRSKNTNTNNYKSTLYLVPYFFRTFTKDTTERKHNIYLFWFLYKRIALAHYWNEKQLSSGSKAESGFYSFPLVRYTNEKDGVSESKFNLSFFYLFYRLLALIHYSSHISLSTRKETMFFIFPLYIHLNFDDENNNVTHTKWSVFWIFYYKLALMRYWNVIIFANKPTRNDSGGTSGEDFKKVRLWKEPIQTQDCSFFIFCLYYFTKQIQEKMKSEMGHYIFWLFYHKLSMIKLSWKTEKKSLLETNDHDNYNHSFYIFPLVLWRSSKENSTTERYFALIWLFHRLISVFYFCKSNFGSTSSILATTSAEHPIGNNARNDTKMTTFLLLIFFYSSDSRVSEKKWSLLWFFARQLSFVRFSRSLKDGYKLLKFLIFPFFKYERWSAHHSRWCLIPFVPIKFSWVANFVVYEKRVKKVGAILDDGKEDKRSRDQNKVVRVLYKVVVWQFVDQVKTLEINPFFASEHDYADGYKSWDILGGCIGRVNNSPEHGDACRLGCCCFV